MTAQLALFELEAPPAPASEPPIGRVYATPAQDLTGFFFIRQYLAACQCEALNCRMPNLHDHGHHFGCAWCACTASWLPPEAVELEFPVEFADGCGIWAKLRSHFWHQRAEIDGEWRVVSSPWLQLRGACSDTGYLSAQFELNFVPEIGWLGWGMATAGEIHRDWHCPGAKRKGKR